MNIDYQEVDWAGAISDVRDYGNRYQAVKDYLARYYNIHVDTREVSATDIGMFEEEQMMDQAANKQGAKRLLKEYYSTGSKKKKQQIKELLLTDAPLHNVLMTAMYNGTDLPNARRFLNEVMESEVIEYGTPAPVISPVVKPVVQPVMDTKKFLLILQVVLSILLVVSILLQVRGSGLGNIFGGTGGEFYRSKRGIEKFLYRSTIVLAIMFVSNCIAIAFLYS